MEENKNLEQNDTVVDDVKETEKAPKEIEKTPEEILAETRVELAKMKRAFDKASSEASNYKKQLREQMSKDGIEAQEKAEKEAERDEELKKLRRENTVYKYKANFLSLGYGDEDAENAAAAQYDGDTDMLFSIQRKVAEATKRAIKAELMRQMPASPISNDSEVSMTQQEFDNMTISQQVDFKREHPDLWKKFAYTK